MAPPSPLYRPGVGILLFDRMGLAFVGERSDAPGAWQMPQGGIDAGEEPQAAALRELAEETGIAHVRVVGATRGWLSYDLPEDLAATMWRGRYKGQRQKWYAIKFLGQDGDIRLDAHTPEFSAWRWVPLPSLVDLIVPFKRDLYAQIVAELSPFVAKHSTPCTP
ncbi:MAG: RNA pyrophosphohydrolase [Telmatospirillum sp.]|nr:RNA pyrophosphohydrolase [Telmatospirillum sp.]